MAITPSALTAGIVVGIVSAPLYTAPAGVHAKVGAAVFTNATTGAVVLTVNITRSGGSAEAIINGLPLSAAQAYVSPELAGLVLNPGDVVSAIASVAASVNVQISGLTF